MAAATDDLVKSVLLASVAAGATPFVPVPWLDDWAHSIALRSVARTVLERHPERTGDAAALVEGYLAHGAPPLGARALVAAARFVVRKMAVVLDVKKSHDVLGETIAFALALDVALATEPPSRALGHRIAVAVSAVGAGPIEALTRAVRLAIAEGGGAAQRFSRIGPGLANEIAAVQARLVASMGGNKSASASVDGS